MAYYEKRSYVAYVMLRKKPVMYFMYFIGLCTLFLQHCVIFADYIELIRVLVMFYIYIYIYIEMIIYDIGHN